MKKSKSPTWQEINSKKNVESLIHRTGNKSIKKFLEFWGWKMWDHCNIYLEGYTISARKVVPELASNRNPYLYFQWQWDNQGDADFWTGTLYGFYDYEQDNNLMHPWAMFEIRDITQKTLPLLSVMEKRVVDALRCQADFDLTFDK